LMVRTWWNAWLIVVGKLPFRWAKNLPLFLTLFLRQRDTLVLEEVFG
jgi:hypothetical protein